MTFLIPLLTAILTPGKRSWVQIPVGHISTLALLFQICKLLATFFLLMASISAQHCTYDDRGVRSVTCFRLTNPYLSKVNGIKTSKYLYDSFKCVNCHLGAIQPNSFNVGSKEKSTFRSMDLEGCAITEVKPHGFGYQGRVKRLILKKNAIKVLYAGNFADVVDLEYLDLSDNLVQKLAANTFQGLNYLKVLDLEGNSITAIDNYAFRDLEELVVLNLKGNNLPGLRYGMFFGAANVKSLLCSLNFISSLESQALTSLGSLEKLDLSYNKLTSIPLELHAITKQLKSLDLSYNNLSVITVSSDILEELKIANISHQAIQLNCSLPALELLDLQSNNMTTLNLATFTEFPLLHSLNLSHNSINQINTTGKLQMRSLKSLDLALNNITTFDYQELYDYTPQLSYISLKANPLLCSFKEEVKEFFAASSIEVFTSRSCGKDTATTVASMEEIVLKNTSAVEDAKECRCSCEGFGSGVFVVIVVFFIVILVVLLFSVCLQCCCRMSNEKYAVSSANLPLVNLAKD